jgi:hypothetical protein
VHDTCPTCLTRDIPPALTRHAGQRTRCGYQCPRCGQQWITERLDTAYPADEDAA